MLNGRISELLRRFAGDVGLSLLLFVIVASAPGCRSATEHRLEADKTAEQIVREAEMEALGKSGPFSVERPSDILRRRLVIDQNLPYSSEASLGTDALGPIEHWPEEDYPKAVPSPEPLVPLEDGQPLKLTLMDALQVGAENSFEYQTLKEDVFRTALDLDLERNEFRNIFAGTVESAVRTDTTGDRTETSTFNSGEFGVSRKLEGGTEFGAALAVDLANLLTMGGASSIGVAADGTIAIPLLRGSGRHIVREPLTQAERNVVYAIYDFERFKQTFAVEIAGSYMRVLQDLDQVRNNEQNYRSLMASARRSRRLADAGRLPEIQVDQAVQNELRARNRWIVATESYDKSVDSFKRLLGLPPDAAIELDRAELDSLVAPAEEMMADILGQEQFRSDINVPPADAPVEPAAPSREGAGPLELNESTAVGLALEHRYDLRVAQGEVYDAQRAVVVAADALRGELTFFGSAGFGDRRDIGDARADDSQLRFDEGVFAGLLTLDLPLERTFERNAYRDSFISLEQVVRQVQLLEDEIKLDVRDRLRSLLESRESLRIQAQSLLVAEKRVKSSNLFLEAGRAQMRDLLEAQDDLLAAQNLLTAAAVSYRIAELELQSDMGVLEIDERGLWKEYRPPES
jgi:outer membrane protein TolC